MLDNTATYEELKAWFLGTDLPYTVDSEMVYYFDVHKTVVLYIQRIEEEIKKHGKDIKQSQIAKETKTKMFNLYQALQDKTKWNAPQPTFEELMKR